MGHQAILKIHSNQIRAFYWLARVLYSQGHSMLLGAQTTLKIGNRMLDISVNTLADFIAFN